MLTIRLFPKGKKNQPFFKIVVTEKSNPPKGGRFVEELGFVNPLTKEKKINKERAKHWLSVGAQPSDTVYNLLIQEKVIEGEKIPLHKKKKAKKGEPAQEEKPKESAPAEKKEEAPQPEKTEEAPEKAEEPPKEEKPAEPAKEEKSEESSEKEKPAESSEKEPTSGQESPPKEEAGESQAGKEESPKESA